MKSITGKEFTKVLERKGWNLLRVNGCHFIYSKKGCTEIISVPVHKNQCLKMGLLKHLMRIANISENEL